MRMIASLLLALTACWRKREKLGKSGSSNLLCAKWIKSPERSSCITKSWRQL